MSTDRIIARATTAATRRAVTRQVARMSDAAVFGLSVEATDPVTQELASHDCHKRAEAYALAN